MIGGYEDDTHFCLKCHATILGLDNYVSHRKSNCGKVLPSEVELPKSPLPSQYLAPDESFSLKADDFFSSLELQSSSKKAATHPTTGGKSFTGILTRSKASAVIQATSSIKDELPPYKKELGTEDNHSKRVDSLNRSILKKDDSQQIRVYDDSDDDSDEYEFDEYSDEDDDQNGPPRSYTGGKWKPTSSPVQWMRPPSTEERDWNAPLPNYSGGKWKPSTGGKLSRSVDSPPPSHTKGKWKPSSPSSSNRDSYMIPPPSYTGSKWTPSKAFPKNDCLEVLPPNHTKGKWKPQFSSLKTDNCDLNAHGSKDYENEYPPPEHTKGKWKPPMPSDKAKHEDAAPSSSNFIQAKDTSRVKWASKKSAPNNKSSSNYKEISPFRKSSGTVQYWCGPCNRRLASKVVYERHLKSELHFKRTLRDREFDDSSYLNTNPAKDNKRASKKPVEYWSHTGTKDNEDALRNSDQSKRKFRRKIFIKCEVCRSRVHCHLLGKHLISHYHCRKGDITQPEAQKMVLENIHSVVLQSPYQCAPCKFYCNTQKYFLTHWGSEDHNSKLRNNRSFFWCSFCKAQATDASIMYKHLISKEHKEVIFVINRSVPIIIKCLTPLECKTCGIQLLFNIQLRKHCEEEQHSYTDAYKSKYVCIKCNSDFKSAVSLQRHKLFTHRENVYICSICSLTFGNITEAKIHRRTKEHRYAVLKKKSESDRKNITKTCEYCSEIFEDFLKLKEHLKKKHPEQEHSCPHCGKTFTIPQDVTVHIRTKSCSFQQGNKKTKSCNQCLFKSDSHSELLFHIALHNEPLIMYRGDATNSNRKPIPQYKCPVCKKYYAKSSLRCHIRLHTSERPFVCTICSAAFIRKNNWLFHMKSHDRKKSMQKNKVDLARECGGRPFLCSACGASFKKKWCCVLRSRT